MVFNDFRNKLANSVFKNVGKDAMPKNFFLGFSTTTPRTDGTNITQPGGNYNRQQLTLSEPINGAVTNVGDVEFGEASAPWGTITYAVIFDEKNTALFCNELAAPVEVREGDIVKVKNGEAKLYFGDAVVGV